MFYGSKFSILMVLGMTTISAEAVECAQMQSDGRVKNMCTTEIVFAFCGVSPKYNSLDCKKQQIGVAGVRPRGTIIDSNHFSTVYFTSCDDGSTPSNLRWDPRGLTGRCR